MLAHLIVLAAASGAFGVDLFFVLSAYLITTLLLREQHQFRKIDIAAFYARRALRIWPLYFVFLLIVLPLAQRLLPGDEFPGRYLAAFLLLAGNWACVWWGYPHSVASPLWSVSMEEQFYLVWPLLMRRWLARLEPVAIALLVLSTSVRLVLVLNGAKHPEIWCNTLAHIDPIACGTLIALRTDNRPVRLSAALKAMLLLGALTALPACTAYGDFTGPRSLLMYPAVALACSGLLIFTLSSRMNGPQAGRAGTMIEYLGRISYGLYVYHALFVGLFHVSTAIGAERPLRAIAALAVTIGVAALSFHALETPFLRLKQRLARVASHPV